MIHVAVGLVYNSQQQILIAKRPDGKHMGGYWEFPGGKVEADESVLSALKREFLEEVGIEITHAKPLKKFTYDYPEKTVLLDVWQVINFNGEAQGKEGQEIRWQNPQDLQQLSFPPANVPILKLLM